MEMNVNNLDGGDNSSLEISDAIFAVDYKEPLIHQVVVSQMAAARSGTSAQKNRAAVSGGGAKPWRQKGTGRARAGTIRSPIFRGGGNTFPAATRSYEQKVNRKMYRGALKSVLSELVRQERLQVVNDLQLAEPKTKLLKAKLDAANMEDVLIIVTGESRNIDLAARNLIHVEVIDASEVSPLTLLQRKNVVCTADALKKIEEGLQ
ncbi:MAG: large subunit ribosomal protein L4 [Parasphingorhabdus sp.]